MGRILALAGVNGAGKSSLLGTWLDAEGLSWFNPDSFTRRLVDAGWPLPEANAEHGRKAPAACARPWPMAPTSPSRRRSAATPFRACCVRPERHHVAIWFCGLADVELHIARVAARVAAGGHDIPVEKIRARFDSARANLLELLPHLAELHVYDNSAPADAQGCVVPLPVLAMAAGELQYPIAVADLLHARLGQAHRDARDGIEQSARLRRVRCRAEPMLG